MPLLGQAGLRAAITCHAPRLLCPSTCRPGLLISNVTFQTRPLRYQQHQHRWNSSNASPAQTPIKAIASKTNRETTLAEVTRLFRLAIPQRKRLIIGVGLMFVSGSISMSVPLFLGKTLDLFTSSATDLPVSLPVAVMGLTGLFVIGSISNAARLIVIRLAGQRIIADARKAAFAKVVQQDLAWYDLQGQKPQKAVTEDPSQDQSQDQSHRHEESQDDKSKELSTSNAKSKTDDGVKSTGDILSRLGSDANIVGDAITRELSDGLLAIFTAFAGLGAMLWISLKLTALVMCLVPPAAIGAVYYGRYIKKLSRRTQKGIGDMVSVAEEKIGAIKTVQAYNSVPAEVAKYQERVEHIYSLFKKEAYASALFFSGLGLVGNVTLVSLLSYGGHLVSQGELTVGQLTSLCFYALYIGRSIGSLTSFYSTIMRGLGASGRLFELMEARPKTVVAGVGRVLSSDEPLKKIVFDRVSFEYPTRIGAPILQNVSLTIEPGHSIAIAGGSGSGKSTVAALLLRFYDPNSGEIRYGDEPIKNLTPESWRDQIAYVEQQPVLFAMTVAENIAYGKPDATREEIEEAAKAANCYDFIKRLPQGFETSVGRKGALLSGGQSQRIAIARALIKKPKILVMDEATSALDSASEALVNEAITRITQSNDLTVILIAHRLSSLRTADTIVMLENGQIAEVGSFAQLSQGNTKFSEMVRNQLLRANTSETAAASSTDVDTEQVKQA